MKFTKRTIVGIVLALLIFCWMSVMQYQRANRAAQLTQAVFHTQDILKALDEVVLALIDGQRGVRGFIITGQERFLEPYTLSMQTIDARFGEAIKLTQDFPDQQQRLQKLKPTIDGSYKIYRDSLELRRKGGFPAAQKIVATGIGKAMMDSFRQQIDKIKSEQEGLLQARLADHAYEQGRSFSAIVFGNAIALIILLATLVLSIFSFKKYETAQNQVAEKAKELSLAYIELDRVRKEQLQTKDQLLSHVSHELRTPLTAAYQYVENLKDGLAGELQAQQRDFVEVAHRNLRQLRNMINDLLEATRAETAKLVIQPERMSVSSAIKETVRNLYSPAMEREIQVVEDLREVPDVIADPNRLRQVLTNLLHNAVKFTPEQGTISIKTSHLPDQGVVQISVTNTGAGINPEALSKLFVRLYQVSKEDATTRKGLGLGLYICKELVKNQGGEIWAESEVGKSTTFHFTLPVFQSAEAKNQGVV